MNVTSTRIFPSLPRAHSLAGARRLQERYSGERGGTPHVIVLGDCTERQETYFVVTPGEARRLIAAGYELLD